MIKDKKMKDIVKKIISFVIAFTILASNIVNANVQIPVDALYIDEVNYILGEDIVTGETLIKPTMRIRWKDPDQWAQNPNGPVHKPEFYELIAENLTRSTKDSVKFYSNVEEYNKKELDVDRHINLRPGSLYKMSVRPEHYHMEGENRVLAPTVGETPYEYAITDLRLDAVADDKSIKIIWDDLGVKDFEYRIVYARGDYTADSKQNLYNNKEGEISGIKSSDEKVEKFYDEKTKSYKLSYKISENIYPGQIYSIIVEPTVDYYKGKKVTRNRNFNLVKTVSTNIVLRYTEDGDRLRLYWDIPHDFKVGSSQNKYELVETKLVEIIDGKEKNLAILNGGAGAIGYYFINKPSKETGYQLKLTYKAMDGINKPLITPVSNILIYSPSQVPIKPTKPIIKELISKKKISDLLEGHTESEIRDILVRDYLVPGDSYDGLIEDLLQLNSTFFVEPKENRVNLAWSAFRRLDINPKSENYNKMITDMAVYYDTYITDDYNALSYARPISKDATYDISNEDKLIKNSAGVIVGFHEKFNQYFDSKTGKIRPLEPNKIYYIKLVAKKKVGNEVYLADPTIVSFYYDAKGNTFAPPVLVKPPLRNKGTTKNEATIAWKEVWWELIDMDAQDGDPLSKWTREVWIGKDNKISDKAIEGARHYPIYRSKEDLDKFIDEIKNNPQINLNLLTREINMKAEQYPVHYEFTKIPYELVKEAIKKEKETNPDYGFDNYYSDLIKADKSGQEKLSWKEIKVKKEAEELTYTEGGLKENTSYLFIINPYRLMPDGSKRYSFFPTPIVITTELATEDINPTPIVPNLYVIDTTDITAKLSFKYNEDFEYEIVYNTIDSLEGAKSVGQIVPDNKLDPTYPLDGEFYQFDVKELFPETAYYFYIRAKRLETGKISAWSNPAFGKTKEVAPPQAPLGLGIAPKYEAKKHGYEAPIGENHFIIQWLKLEEDNPDLYQDARVKKEYSYIVEISESSSFSDPIYVVSGDQATNPPANIKILEKTLIAAEKLIHGRDYYVRVKTRLRVSEAGGREIIKDSLDYTYPIKISTSVTNDEYDGYKDPELIALPDKDYEIIYKDGNLHYRFRSNEIDSSGLRDNQVDQRLISNLIKSKAYVYLVDMEKYKNKPIRSRRLSLPYSVVQALETRKVNLKIKTDKLEVEMPMDSLIHDFVANKEKGYLIIDIKDKPSFINQAGLSRDLLPIAPGQSLAISSRGQKNTKQINYLAKPMLIGLKTENRYDLYGGNPIAYTMQDKGKPQIIKGVYDVKNANYEIATKNVGDYAAFITRSPHTNRLVTNVTKDEYRLTNQAIKKEVFYKALYSIMKDQPLVDAYEPLTYDEKRALIRAKLMAGDENLNLNISRGQAIDAIVKAYEIKHEVKLQGKNQIEKALNEGLIDKTIAGDTSKNLTGKEFLDIYLMLGN